MEPDFVDGDLVLLEPLSHTTTLSAGDVVVARHPFKSLDVIKYVHSIDDDEHLQLRSPTGDDSRQFGRVPRPTIRGLVTLNVTQRRKPERRSP